jgi:hypothetical protein
VRGPWELPSPQGGVKAVPTGHSETAYAAADTVRATVVPRRRTALSKRTAAAVMPTPFPRALSV